MEIKDEDAAKLLLVYASEGTTLVHSSDKHYKFWNIKANKDGSITTTWGRIGNTPQSNTLPPALYPQYIIMKAVKGKLQKGYEIFSEN